MTSVHTVRPTDLAALVAYNGRVYPNEAVTRDRIGTQMSPHPLEAALEQWFSFATGRHTWISVKGATLRGLASARRRGANAAWEVDCLIDAADDDSSVLLSLLDQMAADAGRAGAERIFLRVAAESPVLELAVRCGFAAYQREHLLAAEDIERDESEPVAPLRQWARADAYPAFRLYNRWTPELVRRHEAVTFREWKAARERISPERGTRQWVLEREERIDGWLRGAAVGELGRFDLMADPDQPDLLEPLMAGAMRRLAEQSALIALVPEFAVELRSRLERRGFFDRGEFVVLVRRTVRPVEAPEQVRAVPVQSFPA
jgi:hypothetical protein